MVGCLPDDVLRAVASFLHSYETSAVFRSINTVARSAVPEPGNVKRPSVLLRSGVLRDFSGRVWNTFSRDRTTRGRRVWKVAHGADKDGTCALVLRRRIMYRGGRGGAEELKITPVTLWDRRACAKGALAPGPIKSAVERTH
jgi:hypothetical protein